MKRALIGICALSVVFGTVDSAEIYRWVDENGKVEYRDTPPPSSAKKVEQRRPGGAMVETSTLPFSVQQAVRNFPVTLWNASCGAPCDQARAHLARRGVPFTEKDAQADVEAFKKLTGGIDVPVLYVGSNRVNGYFESEWDSALDIAGYPRTPPPGTASAARSAATGARPPVKLYTHPECGAPCVEAKSLLASRKVPFQEITAQEQAEIDELQQISGATRVPVLLVGSVVTRGYSPGEYNMALDAAGFPRAGSR